MIFKLVKYLNIINWIYPNYCRECGLFINSDIGLCEKCKQKIKLIVSTSLPITPKYSLNIFSISDYTPPLKSFILRKFYDEPLASKQLGKLVCEFTPIKNFEFDYIIPIPLHWTRYAKRGFNQSKIMSKEIGKICNVPVLDCLSRVKRTKFQSHLSGIDKEKNLKNAFRLKKRKIEKLKDILKNKRILIVDDLSTSGATLKNAARILVDLNPYSLFAVVVCRKL